MEEIFNKDYAKVLYDSGNKLIKVIWCGQIKGNAYKELFKFILNWVYAGNPVIYFYSDTRERGIVPLEDRDWFTSEMFPLAVKAGLQKVALVSDTNAFKRYYINTTLKALKKFSVPFKIFADEGAAMSFLLNPEN